ncbi:MAG: winged helix-turn-helix transcriptional regulator [Verrucomicrobia bacterium]|jgi:predicted transcriptional regulator|nr:winged helix-turn-helix transcriptional regulator [Verrucomicrobiota bacterium]
MSIQTVTKINTDAKPRSSWTFLSNHTHVLACLARNPDIVLREVSYEVGITERAVQRIVQELVEEGVLKRQKLGRQNHYMINRGFRLRHAIERHRTIGNLLDFISH